MNLLSCRATLFTLLGTAIVSLICLSGCISPPPEEKPTNKDQIPVNGNIAIKIAAQSLIEEYKENALKFRDKILEINGEVSSIDKTSDGTPFILLRSGSDGVKCFFAGSARNALEQLPKNCNLALKGICTGRASNIWIEGCSLVGSPKVRNWWTSNWSWLLFGFAVLLLLLLGAFGSLSEQRRKEKLQ